MTMYHNGISSGDIKFIHICDPHFEQQTANHSEGSWATSQGGHYHMAINSFDRLLGFFHELSNRGILLDGMDFHTHGVADELGYRIGISFCTPTTLEETLNYINARRFSGLSRSIFKAGANITFYGCAVGRIRENTFYQG